MREIANIFTAQGLSLKLYCVDLINFERVFILANLAAKVYEVFINKYNKTKKSNPLYVSFSPIQLNFDHSLSFF